jgi:outer membrane protein assembly factor BamB
MTKPNVLVLLAGAACLLAIILPVSGPAHGADWPCWRNAARDGASAETINTDWTAKPPVLLWSKTVGPNDSASNVFCYASISVVGDRAYTMGFQSGTETVYCLDAATGAEIWKFSYASPAGGARSTPNVTAGVVYTVSRVGNVFALDAATGAKIWNSDLSVTPGIISHRHGISTSAVVEGSLVILNAGTEGIALDKTTGAVVWQKGTAITGFSTPFPFTAGDGTRGMMFFTATGMAAVEPATGRRMWLVPWVTGDTQSICDPVISGDKIFVSSGYNTGCGVYRFTATGATQVWRSQVLCNMWITCNLKDGYLYGIHGYDTMWLKCVEFDTGVEKWSKQLDRWSTHILVDGKLLTVTDNGTMRLVDASPTGYHEIAANSGLIGTWMNQDAFHTPPTLANGRLYTRSYEGRLMCVDLSPPPSAAVRGDANGDGGFSLADINQMVDWLLGRSAAPASGSAKFTVCDVNGDGSLSLADLNLFVDKMLGRIAKFPVEP